MTFFLKKIISAFVVPPMAFLWLAVLGAFCLKKRPRFGKALIFTALAGLILLSMPYVSHQLHPSLSRYPALIDFEITPKPDAIVVPGCGVYAPAPEFGAPTVSGCSLERLRYAAFLQRKTALPILVSGGDPGHHGVSEAGVMAKVLQDEFHVNVKWIEAQSRDTVENARYARQILAGEGIKRIYLATHSWHMPRAMLAFEAAGFEAIAAPTIIKKDPVIDFWSFVPNAQVLQNSAEACHEWVGKFTISLATRF